MKIGVYYRVNKGELFYREFKCVYDYEKWYINKLLKGININIIEVVE